MQKWSKERRPAGFADTLKRFQAQDRTARMTGEIEKEGFDTGRTAINPFTNRPVPIWVAELRPWRVRHGRVMGVPGHDQRDFEFARKYDLPITVVVSPTTDLRTGSEVHRDSGGNGATRSHRWSLPTTVRGIW